jgi:hypothetical protein
MPTDPTVVHSIDKEVTDPGPVPEGAAVVGNPPHIAKPREEQVKELLHVFNEARTRSRKEKWTVKAGLNPHVLAVGPLLHGTDEVAVSGLVRRPGRLELEVAHTQTTTIDRNMAWRPLIQVPADLPPGSYTLVVTWRAVEALPAGKPIGAPVVGTFDFDIVKGLAFSKPVRAGAVEFEAVVDPRCPVPAKGAFNRLNVGLRFTNRGDKEVVLNLFDTICMNLKSAEGKVFQVEGGRNGTLPAQPPQRLRPGQSGTVFRTGRIEWQADGKALVLAGPDGAGGVWLFRGLGPGKYLLSIKYTNPETPPGGGNPARPYWTGEAETEPVEFEITAPPK